MEKKSDKELFNVGATVEGAIDRSRNLKGGVLKAQWAEIMDRAAGDPRFALESQPDYIKNGVLYVTIGSPPLLHALTMEKKKLILIINEYFEDEVVEDIKIRMGKLDDNRDEYLKKEEIIQMYEERHGDQKPQEETSEEGSYIMKDGDFSKEGIERKIEYLKNIAMKREKYLLSHGYHKCKCCGMLFQSDDGEKDFCKVCIEEKKYRKYQKGNN